MIYLALFLVLVIIVIITIFIIYNNSTDDDINDSTNNTYEPIPPPTLQYNRTIDAPRRNPDLFGSSGKNYKL